MKFLNKTIEYGLYLLVFLLPVQTRWIIKAGELNGGYWEYGTYALYGTDILLILLLLLFVVREIAASPDYRLLAMTEERLPRRPEYGTPRNDRLVYWFIGGWLLMSAVSVFFAVNKSLALYKLGWLILGLGLFWLIASANYGRLKLIYASLAGAFLQATLGGWQFLTQSSFADKWLGLAMHRAADLGTSVIETAGADGVGERWLRAYGGLDHPNILGGLAAIAALILIWEMIRLDKFSIFNFQFSIFPAQARTSNFQTIFKIINWIFLAVFTAGLFFSFSRSAWLALAAGLALMMMRAAWIKNLKLQKGLAEIILVMGVLLFILFGQYQNLITSRLGGEGRLEEKSTKERLVSYQESWRLIKNNWLFGAGPGNYTLALSRQAPGQAGFYYQPAHNVFLLVISEIGIFGFALFVALLFVIARSPESSGRRGNLTDTKFSTKPVIREIASLSPVARNDNGVAILVALVVLLSLDHWLFSLHYGVLFFWLVLGLVVSSQREENSGFPPARE